MCVGRVEGFSVVLWVIDELKDDLFIGMKGVLDFEVVVVYWFEWVVKEVEDGVVIGEVLGVVW